MIGEWRTVFKGPNKGYTGKVINEMEDYASGRGEKMITWVTLSSTEESLALGGGTGQRRVKKSDTKKAPKTSQIAAIEDAIRQKVIEIRGLILKKKEAEKPAMAEKEINALLAKVTMDEE